MSEFTVNQLVTCRANGNMRRDFTGQIKKLYENSALVNIVDCHADDAFNARELQYMAIIAYKRMQDAAVDIAIDGAVG